MIARARRLLGHRIVQNTVALYGVQFCRKIIPLLSIPYLTRTLGPTAWGSMAIVLSTAFFVVMLCEFGFNVTATREIARNRESKATCSEVVAGVIGVQIILFLLGILAAFIASRYVPMLGNHPDLLWAGLIYCCSQCFVPLWFFQGMEWMRSASTMEIAGKVLALVGLLLFVHSPADAWKALALQGLPFSIQSVIGIWMMYREVPFRRPNVPLVRDAMLRGWNMFLFRGGASLYTIANSFILGLFAAPALVGFYAAAEKINSAMLGLINPIQDALFPRLSRLATESPEKAARLATIGAGITAIVGIVMPLGMFIMAPTFVHVLAGPKFDSSIPVLRILALLLPFSALTASLGMQWLLPIGKDRVMMLTILGGGALNIILACILAPRFFHIGSAWAAVLSEAFVGLTTVWATIKYTGIIRNNQAFANLRTFWKNRNVVASVPRVISPDSK